MSALLSESHRAVLAALYRNPDSAMLARASLLTLLVQHRLVGTVTRQHRTRYYVTRRGLAVLQETPSPAIPGLKGEA